MRCYIILHLHFLTQKLLVASVMQLLFQLRKIWSVCSTMHLHWLSSQSKNIQIIWYRCNHFFKKSGCHLPWKCFPILSIVPDAILTSITRYFAHYWHWLTHSCPTFTRSTLFSYSSQCTWTSSKPTFFFYSS